MGLGEDAMDDDMSLTAPVSSPDHNNGADTPQEHAAQQEIEQRGQGVAGSHEQAVGNECGSSNNNEQPCWAEILTNETTTPLSVPLEGDQGSWVMSGNTKVYGEGSEPLDSTPEVQRGTQRPRHTNGTSAGQQHDTNACSEGQHMGRTVQQCT
ncbi:hypothetical protein BU15DRAFT_67557 [Melanogaster broomeanus]|nr:hypothetical protein BU15DRAFT_67557 [Melanogaster broomeanus]